MTINHLLITCRKYTEQRQYFIQAANAAHVEITAHNLLQGDEDLAAGVIHFLVATNLISEIWWDNIYQQQKRADIPSTQLPTNIC